MSQGIGKETSKIPRPTDYIRVKAELPTCRASPADSDAVHPPLLQDSDIAKSATAYLASHIREHPKYFPVKPSSPELADNQTETWTTWVQQTMQVEWEEYISQIKNHESECVAMHKEMDEMRKAASEAGRKMSVNRMMAIRRRSMEEQRAELRQQMEMLELDISADRKCWQTELKGLRSLQTDRGLTVVEKRGARSVL